MNPANSSAARGVSMLPYDILDQIATHLPSFENARPWADFQALGQTCSHLRAWASNLQTRAPVVHIPGNRVGDLKAAVAALLDEKSGPGRLLREPRLQALFSRVRSQQARAGQARVEALSVVCQAIVVELESASVGQLKHVLNQVALVDDCEQAKLVLTHILRLARELAPEGRASVLKEVTAALEPLPPDWRTDLGELLSADCAEWPPAPLAHLLLQLDWTARGFFEFDVPAFQSMLAAVPPSQWRTLLPQVAPWLAQIPALIDCVLEAPGAPQADIVAVLSEQADRAMKAGDYRTLLRMLSAPDALGLCKAGEKLHCKLREWFLRWFPKQKLTWEMVNDELIPMLEMQVQAKSPIYSKCWRACCVAHLGACARIVRNPALVLPCLLAWAETARRPWSTDAPLLPHALKINGKCFSAFSLEQFELAVALLGKMQDLKGRKGFWRHMVDYACLHKDGAPKRQLVIALASAACQWHKAALVGARDYMLSDRCHLGRELRKEVKVLFKQAGF